MSLGRTEDRGAKEDAGRSEDGRHVDDGSSLARKRTREAMEHAIHRGGGERPGDGEWLADVGLDGRDVQALQPPGCVIEDVPIGVEEGDRAPVRQAGSFQEVARTWTHVEVPGPRCRRYPSTRRVVGHRQTTGVKKPRIRGS